MKQFYSMLAVFDLDGTLYEGNSHIEILCAYYHTNFYKSLPFRGFAFFLSSLSQKIMDWKYAQIPMEVKSSFAMPYRGEVLKILRDKQKDGHKTIILSSAPEELICHASKDLSIEGRKACAGKKHELIQEEYAFDRLFVCTDNKTDIDLLSMATEAVIACPERHRSYFRERLPNHLCVFL